jgi:hypothetical protein
MIVKPPMSTKHKNSLKNKKTAKIGEILGDEE